MSLPVKSFRIDNALVWALDVTTRRELSGQCRSNLCLLVVEGIAGTREYWQSKGLKRVDTIWLG